MIFRPFILAAIISLAAAPSAAQPSASAGAWRSDVSCTAGPAPVRVNLDDFDAAGSFASGERRCLPAARHALDGVA